MSWNYRITKRRGSWRKIGTDVAAEDWSIREVYYDDEGKPNGHADASLGGFETAEDLIVALNAMFDARSKPVLDLDETFKEDV